MKKVIPFRLNPAFSLHTRFSLVKLLPAQTGVSYGATYLTKNNEWVGTIPIGYADGWSRRLSNRGEALVNGKRVPFIGRICMDQTMVRLDHKVARDVRVTLIGTQDNEEISMDEVAEKLGTINYEIPCIISARVPRIYVRSGGKNFHVT
jgi:alanine racemase